MFKTMSEITSDVILELGLVQGSGVQQYTEPQIEKAVQTQFITLIQKRFWEHITFNTVHDLDGSSGTITSSLEDVPAIEDIDWIRYSPYEKHNTFEPLAGSPYLSNMMYRYERRRIDDASYKSKKFVIYPLTLNVPIMVRARRYKLSYLPDELIPFDAVALTHFVASHLLAIEGLNPSAEQRHAMLFDQRYKDLISNEGPTISRYRKDAYDTFTVAE